MRVLRIADVPNNRSEGMPRTIHFLNDALAALGHHVDTLFREDLKAPGPARLRRFTIPLLLPHLVRRLAAGGGGYDVVEIHEPLAAAYCALRRAGATLPPVVVFSYGLEERGHAAELWYRRAKGLRVSLKSRISPWSVIAQARYAVRHADHVVCCSTADLRHLRAAGVPESRLSLHRCAPHDAFLLDPGPPGAGADAAPALLFVGSWLPRKGIAELVPAITRVLRDVPAARFTAATHPAAAGRVLASFPADVRGRVAVVAGADGNGPLAALYRRHDVLVLPSYFEGQPMVMVEAAALGLAVVTTAACGMLDFVRDGMNGLLVGVGDADALAAALLRLCRDPAARRRLGAAARQTARALTWLDAARTLEAAYRRAISGGSEAAGAGGAWSPPSGSGTPPIS